MVFPLTEEYVKYIPVIGKVFIILFNLNIFYF